LCHALSSPYGSRRDLICDAGIAADQEHRAVHETVAGDLIQLGRTGGQARLALAPSGQGFQLEQPGADRDRDRGGIGCVLFRKRIPLAASLALALQR
jgi:hypothetical protein